MKSAQWLVVVLVVALPLGAKAGATLKGKVYPAENRTFPANLFIGDGSDKEPFLNCYKLVMS
jgi:hypothetical protein